MKTNPLQIIHRVRRSAWTLPLAALAALVLFAINETAYDRSSTALAVLGERGEARTQIQLVWRAHIDAETGQRGYLLTGRKEYLQPYQGSVASVHEALAWLDRYYAGDGQAAPVLAALKRHSAAKLSELQTTLAQYDAGRHEAWRELLLTDIGREQMEGMRLASQQLLDLETTRVASDRGHVFVTLRGGRVGVNAMTVLSLIALFLFLRQTLAFDRAQRRHAQTLQSERDRLDDEVTRRTADLTELARHLQTAREDEKSRLARELHDELGALLTAAKLDVARLKRLIGVPSPDIDARLRHLNESINRGIDLKRRIIEDLRPSSLSNLGLVAAFEILVREYGTRSDAQVSGEFDAVDLTDSAQITAYRMVQEALTNVSKHAAARQVRVTMHEEERDGRLGTVVTVVDDGRGFDPGVRRGTTHGLMGMRYRIEAEGGTMRIESAPGAGTRIEAWLPAREPGEEPAAGEEPAETGEAADPFAAPLRRAAHAAPPVQGGDAASGTATAPSALDGPAQGAGAVG